MPAPSADLLRELLDLTVEETALKRRINLIRAEVDSAAQAETIATGIAPTWKIKGLGQIRIDGYDPDPAPVAYVADPAAFASWLAQTQPTEVVAAIAVGAEHLADALSALEFADVPVLTGTVTPRAGVADRVMKTLELDQVEDTEEWLAVDPKTGQVVPGVSGRPGFAKAKLVVAADAKVKQAAVDLVDTAWAHEHPEPDAEADAEAGDDTAKVAV